MSIGQAMTNRTLPVASVTAGPTYATLLQAFLTEVRALLEAKIGCGSLSPDAELDFNDYAIKDLKSTGYTNESVDPSTVRRIYFRAGELYAKDHAGNVVKITSGGNLNTAALTAAPAATEVIVIRSDGVIRTNDLESPPTFRVTNPDIQHGERTLVLPASQAQSSSATKASLSFGGGSPYAVVMFANPAAGGSARVAMAIPLAVGDRIKRVCAYVRQGQGTWTLRCTDLDITGAGAGTAAEFGATDTSVIGTAYETLDSGAVTQTVASGHCYYAVLEASADANAGQELLAVEIVFDRVT